MTSKKPDVVLLSSRKGRKQKKIYICGMERVIIPPYCKKKKERKKHHHHQVGLLLSLNKGRKAEEEKTISS